MTDLLGTIATFLRDEDPRRVVTWNDLVIHRNLAPLPSPYPGSDTMWNRGFDFLVLDATGHPAHFGRCRDAADARAVRASELRSRLSGIPDLDGIVPRTRYTLTDTLLVEISRYVRGNSLKRDIAQLDGGIFIAGTRQILAAARRLTDHAERHIDGFLASEEPVAFLDAADAALRFLEQAGLDPSRHAAIRQALLAGGRAVPRVQHGDLWPANVLRHAHGFVLLDFEAFGDVRVPLYDAFHFLRNSLLYRAAPHGESTLVGVLRGSTPDVAAAQGIIRDEAQRDALTPPQVVAAFSYYLVAMTASVRGRQGAEEYWRPYWRCLETLADRLRDAADVDRLLLGSAPLAP